MRTLAPALLAAVALLTALTGPADALDRRLDGQQVTDRLAGNTVHIITADRDPISAYLGAGGSMRGRAGGKSIDGHWSVHDGALCTAQQVKAAAVCDTVILRDGKRLFLFTAAGRPDGELTVRRGNPDKF